jgi:uncharacterized tellurite resistance protein B-like protein
MLAKLKAFFDSALATTGGEAESSTEEQVQMASAILLLEVARTDHQLNPEELREIKTVIQSKFSLSEQATTALMDEADSEIDQVIDFHQFTSLLNQHFSVEQKCLLIEYMWQIALSDGHLDGYEDQFIRKIGDLLYLRHPELLSARERAKSNLQSV